jgi:hypothetical protein
MKKLILILGVFFLLASCSSEPSLPLSHSKKMKVVLIERASDSTSLYHINMDGQGSEYLIRIEERNGFASVGDAIGLLNLSKKFSLVYIKDTAVVKETNKSPKN